MEIKKEKRENTIRLDAVENGEEIGAVYLYLIRNDSHAEPYGLIEDLLVKEGHRRQGVGTALIKEALAEAKRLCCYKVICTSRLSREEVHRFYEKLGLKKHGFEFRINF
ncbi:MAG: GNAT family N-acetyltransferase [Candidatus Yonathbacteria bacterium]|nr:GNAT family N-acetyltransferase [Candidatus Yonathbacteria bacterium]